MRRRVLITVLLAALLPAAVTAGAWFYDGMGAVRRAERVRLADALALLRELGAASPVTTLPASVQRASYGTGLQLAVLHEDGNVLAAADLPTPDADRLSAHPEVRAALRSGREGEPAFAGRAAALAIGSPRRRRVYWAAVPPTTAALPWLGPAGCLVLALALGYWLAQRLSRRWLGPLEALATAAEQIAAGAPRTTMRTWDDEPMRRLASALGDLAGQSHSHQSRAAEQQQFLDAVVRQIPEGLLVVEDRGIVTRASAAAEKLLGLPADRLVGRPLLASLFSYSVDEQVRRVLAGQPGGGVELVTRGGRSLQVAVAPLRVGTAAPGAVLLLQDVTEARRVDAMRRDFVANVSHELRTPVAAIRALVETLILRGARRPELLADYAPRVVEECERVDRLVQDLLLLAETEAGAVHLQPVPLDAREVAEDILALVGNLAGPAGVRLVQDSFPEEPVLADRRALEQCLRNLMENAVRYAGEGEVRVGGRREGEHILLWVADQGPGIPPEALPRIFERFYRVDPARERTEGKTIGSGLGLAIVRHLAEAQGGRVWAESVLGQGSTFFLSLPTGSIPPESPAAHHSG